MNIGESSVQIESIIKWICFLFDFTSLVIANPVPVPSVVYMGFDDTAEAPKFEEMCLCVTFSWIEPQKSRNGMLAVPIPVVILNREI